MEHTGHSGCAARGGWQAGTWALGADLPRHLTPCVPSSHSRFQAGALFQGTAPYVFSGACMCEVATALVRRQSLRARLQDARVQVAGSSCRPASHPHAHRCRLSWSLTAACSLHPAMTAGPVQFKGGVQYTGIISGDLTVDGSVRIGGQKGLSRPCGVCATCHSTPGLACVGARVSAAVGARVSAAALVCACSGALTLLRPIVSPKLSSPQAALVRPSALATSWSPAPPPWARARPRPLWRCPPTVGLVCTCAVEAHLRTEACLHTKEAFSSQFSISTTITVSPLNPPALSPTRPPTIPFPGPSRRHQRARPPAGPDRHLPEQRAHPGQPGGAALHHRPLLLL